RPDAQEALVRLCGKAVRLARSVMAPRAQNRARFVDGRVQLRSHAIRLPRNANTGVLAELLKVSCYGHGDVVVAARKQVLPLLFPDSDDRVDLPVNADFLVQWINPG